MKNAKRRRRITPSTLPIVADAPLKKLKTRRVRRTDTPMQRGISNLMFFLSTATGKRTAVSPRMPRTLKILDPTTFPIATSALPFTAPMKLTTSSGIDVPTPTIAAPMTKSETLNFLAMDTAPATRKSAPKTIPANDTIRIIYSIAI